MQLCQYELVKILCQFNLIMKALCKPRRGNEQTISIFKNQRDHLTTYSWLKATPVTIVTWSHLDMKICMISHSKYLAAL